MPHTSKTILIAACLLLSASSGFSQQKRKATPKKELDLHRAVALPEVATLEKRIKALESKVWQLEYNSRKDKSVELDTSSDVFERLDSNNGSFLVRVTKAEPYLNGYKVYLAIGNTSSVTFSGFDLSLKWSIKPPEGNVEEWSKWWDGRKTKKEHFPQDLEPGRWNTVVVILTPTRADELGYFEIALTTNSLAFVSSWRPTSFDRLLGYSSAPLCREIFSASVTTF
jgi:hypothetical protein